MATAPNLTYTITCVKPSLDGGLVVPIPLGSKVRLSFAEGFNKIYVIFNSDISLSKYEARVTRVGDEYGVGIGTVVYSLSGAIAANTNHAYLITVSEEGFFFGDTDYRISMYAQNAIDYTWDATYLLLTSEGSYILDKDGNQLEVLVQETNYSIVERVDDDAIDVQNLTSATKNGRTMEVN